MIGPEPEGVITASQSPCRRLVRVGQDPMDRLNRSLFEAVKAPATRPRRPEAGYDRYHRRPAFRSAGRRSSMSGRSWRALIATIPPAAAVRLVASFRPHVIRIQVLSAVLVPTPIVAVALFSHAIVLLELPVRYRSQPLCKMRTRRAAWSRFL